LHGSPPDLPAGFGATILTGYGMVSNTIAGELSGPGTFTLECKVSNVVGSTTADSVVTAIKVGNLTSS
jgi:hypothetical protein